MLRDLEDRGQGPVWIGEERQNLGADAGEVLPHRPLTPDATVCCSVAHHPDPGDQGGTMNGELGRRELKT